MTEDSGRKPSLEKHISQAASNGWAFFDGPLAETAAARAKEAEERSDRPAAIAATLYAQVPEFRELLEYLADLSLHRQQYHSPLLGVDPMQNYCYGVFREGQNSMVDTIFKLIAHGRGQQLKGREP
jgi:glutathionylspermidine synthase